MEALGARLDMASLRDAMHVVLSGAASTPRSAGGIEHVWGRLEGLLDQVANRASCSYAEPRAERSYAMRAQLKGACQSTLVELDNLRSLLMPVNCAEIRPDEVSARREPEPVGCARTAVMRRSHVRPDTVRPQA